MFGSRRPPELEDFQEQRRNEGAKARRLRRALTHASGMPIELQHQQAKSKWTLATLRGHSPAARKQTIGTREAPPSPQPQSPAPTQPATAVDEVNRRLQQRGEQPLCPDEVCKLQQHPSPALPPSPLLAASAAVAVATTTAPPSPSSMTKARVSPARVIELEKQVDLLSARCSLQAADNLALQAELDAEERTADLGFRLSRHFAEMKAAFDVQLTRTREAGIRIGELVATERYEERIAQLQAELDAATTRGSTQQRRKASKAALVGSRASISESTLQRQLAERDATILELRSQLANCEAQMLLETVVAMRKQQKQQPSPVIQTFASVEPIGEPPSSSLAPTSMSSTESQMVEIPAPTTEQPSSSVGPIEMPPGQPITLDHPAITSDSAPTTMPSTGSQMIETTTPTTEQPSSSVEPVEMPPGQPTILDHPTIASDSAPTTMPSTGSQMIETTTPTTEQPSAPVEPVEMPPGQPTTLDYPSDSAPTSMSSTGSQMIETTTSMNPQQLPVEPLQL